MATAAIDRLSSVYHIPVEELNVIDLEGFTLAEVALYERVANLKSPRVSDVAPLHDRVAPYLEEGLVEQALRLAEKLGRQVFDGLDAIENPEDPAAEDVLFDDLDHVPQKYDPSFTLSSNDRETLRRILPILRTSCKALSTLTGKVRSFHEILVAHNQQCRISGNDADLIEYSDRHQVDAVLRSSQSAMALTRGSMQAIVVPVDIGFAFDNEMDIEDYQPVYPIETYIARLSILSSLVRSAFGVALYAFNPWSLIAFHETLLTCLDLDFDDTLLYFLPSVITALQYVLMIGFIETTMVFYLAIAISYTAALSFDFAVTIFELDTGRQLTPHPFDAEKEMEPITDADIAYMETVICSVVPSLDKDIATAEELLDEDIVYDGEDPFGRAERAFELLNDAVGGLTTSNLLQQREIAAEAGENLTTLNKLIRIARLRDGIRIHKHTRDSVKRSFEQIKPVANLLREHKRHLDRGDEVQAEMTFDLLQLQDQWQTKARTARILSMIVDQVKEHERGRLPHVDRAFLHAKLQEFADTLRKCSPTWERGAVELIQALNSGTTSERAQLVKAFNDYKLAVLGGVIADTGETQHHGATAFARYHRRELGVDLSDSDQDDTAGNDHYTGLYQSPEAHIRIMPGYYQRYASSVSLVSGMQASLAGVDADTSTDFYTGILIQHIKDRYVKELAERPEKGRDLDRLVEQIMYREYYDLVGAGDEMRHAINGHGLQIVLADQGFLVRQ